MAVDIINPNEFIWENKYRPQRVKDCILPSVIKAKANNIVKVGQLQNMLFYGTQGTGKTTLATAICKELELDYIIINGSREGRLIDTVRNIVSKFANTMSVDGVGNGNKIVIYDEFDNAGDVQMAIRGLMDEVSVNCRFIFTGNYISKIIDPIKSRTTMIDFFVPVEERPVIMSEMLGRCCEILDNENVPYDKAVIAEFIAKKFPDFRNIINELQSYSSVGQIDIGILSLVYSRYEEIVNFIIDKDFKSVLKWTANNTYDGSIYSHILRELKNRVDDSEIWLEIVLITENYQYRQSFAIDPDISLWAYIIEVMNVL